MEMLSHAQDEKGRYLYAFTVEWAYKSIPRKGRCIVARKSTIKRPCKILDNLIEKAGLHGLYTRARLEPVEYESKIYMDFQAGTLKYFPGLPIR